MSTGCEQVGDRPAVIVSNNKGNKFAPIVEVVFLTAQNKKRLPTHVQITSTTRLSTALCEQVTTVSKERLTDFMGCLTQEEMELIDKAILISLGITESKGERNMNNLMNKPNLTPIEIALEIDTDGKTTAKKLYEFLELDQKNYSRWCKTNIIDNQFADEGMDYEVFFIDDENPQGGRPTQDFKLTASFAKKLSMLSKTEKGEQARNYFLLVEEKAKEFTKPMSTIELLELQIRATKEVSLKVETVDKDLQAFKQDMPILGIEESRITCAVRGKGVKCLDGKETPAYNDKSLRGKVYADIYGQLKREFGVASYKAIKRSQCSTAVKIINSYALPTILKEQVENANEPRCMYAANRGK